MASLSAYDQVKVFDARRVLTFEVLKALAKKHLISAKTTALALIDQGKFKEAVHVFEDAFFLKFQLPVNKKCRCHFRGKHYHETKCFMYHADEYFESADHTLWLMRHYADCEHRSAVIHELNSIFSRY